MPRRSLYRHLKLLKGWKNTEENIDRSKIVAVDNTFATETVPDDISSKSPEVFKKCYNVEPQRSFPTLDGKENTGLHNVAISYYLIRSVMLWNRYILSFEFYALFLLFR